MLVDTVWHGVDDCDQTGGILTVLDGHGCEGGICEEIAAHAVLEDDATDSDADGLAKGTEEGEHGD